MLNRRTFLASLAAVAFDPERALWVPGRKLISIPKPTITPEQYEQEKLWLQYLDDDGKWINIAQVQGIPMSGLFDRMCQSSGLTWGSEPITLKATFRNGPVAG